MVWFQCEDCGENLKKPKLSSHFRNCYATKLSCIDCGQMFSQDTVQGHNQCITEAEKYGPKGQVKPSNGTTTNTKSANQKPDVDINVGLSDRPPWYCSLCKTNATSKQALLLHADGKKHRGKARGFHAANQASKQAEVPASTEKNSSKNNTEESLQENKDVNVKRTEFTTEGTVVHERKRKLEETDNVISQERKLCVTSVETCNGEVIQAAASKCDKTESNGVKSLKWKKLITATLKTGPNEGLKMRKLKKLVIKALKEAGATENEDELNSRLEHKINSSSKIEIVGKYVRLAPKN